MKTLSILTALALAWAAPAATNPRVPARVPPAGVALSDKDRAELQTGADALANEIAALRTANLSELLPDVEIFHKAVDWALRYDEFYRTNEVWLARDLLQRGQERAQQLREGKPAWLSATGLVVRGYRSKIDGSVQPYGLVVPASFQAEAPKPFRLDVWLHGRDDKLTELKFIADRQRSYGEFTPANTFVLHPYGRYCNAFKFAGEVDVFEAMDQVMKSYRIDDTKVALRGFSMGGAGVWHLAAHHPDVWAVASPGAGFAETAEYTKALAKALKPPGYEQKLWQLYDATDYAVNFANLPVVAYNGTEDPQRQAADVMERAMKLEGLTLPRVWGTNVPHKWTPEAKREVSRFVDDAVAAANSDFPKVTRFTTRTLRYNQTRHVRVDELAAHWERADITISNAFDGHLDVWTKNVTAFTIFGIKDSPAWLKAGVQINGRAASGSMGFATPSGAFQSYRLGTNGNWSGDRLEGLRKQHGLQGPIDDAFMDSFLFVRPTGKPQSEVAGAWATGQLAKAVSDWRAQFRGDAPVKDDTQVTDADIAEHNLVLFGDAESNKLLARMADKLPIRWNAYSVQVGTNSFPAATHAPIFIFPNPLNPRRYMVLNSGFTFAAAGSGSNAQQTPKLPDYAVIKLTDGSVALADFFDEQWRVR